jgi:FtsH-binding integral membrane protein
MAKATTMQAKSEVRINRFMALTYLIMALGMVVTAFVATEVSNNKQLVTRIIFDPWFAFGLLIIQIVIVTALSAAVMRLSPGVAFLLFIFYSGLTGLTLSSIFLFYTQSVIAHTFWVAAGMFFLTSIVGLLIKRDLSGLGLFLLMVLMGWVFSGFIIWFFPFSQGLNQAYNFTGILLFSALTVWDTQRLKEMAKQMEGRQGMGGLVVLGALSLYLDFINLFLLLLRTSRNR